MNIKSYTKAFIVGQAENKAAHKKLKEINKKRTIVNLSDWELNNVKQVTNCKQETNNESKV
jgi:hypothetical protein